MPGFARPRTLVEIQGKFIDGMVGWSVTFAIIVLLVIGSTSAPCRYTGPAHHHAEVVMP